VRLVAELGVEYQEILHAFRAWRVRGRWPLSGERWEQPATLLDLFDEIADQEEAPRYQ